MKRLVPRDRMTTALLVLCGLLILIVLAEVYLQEPVNLAIDREVANNSIEIPAYTDAEFIPVPQSNYAEILERPLLFESRRMPPEPEVAAEPAQQKSPLRLKLEGVAISSNSRVALLRDLGNKQLMQLTEGMSHDGWTLASVHSSAVIFRRGDDVSRILLETETRTRRRR